MQANPPGGEILYNLRLGKQRCKKIPLLIRKTMFIYEKREKKYVFLYCKRNMHAVCVVYVQRCNPPKTSNFKSIGCSTRHQWGVHTGSEILVDGNKRRIYIRRSERKQQVLLIHITLPPHDFFFNARTCARCLPLFIIIHRVCDGVVVFSFHPGLGGNVSYTCFV